MKTKDAIKYFGNQVKLAEALEIHEANITRWKKSGVVPLKRALELASMTNGELALNLGDY